MMKTAKDLVYDYLKAANVTPSENEIGLSFNFQGLNFLLWHDEEDPLFYRLTIPGVFDVTDENFAEAIMASNSVNWNFKVVKAVVYEYEDDKSSGSSVWICFEQLLDSTPEVGDIVPRSIHMMIAACEAFMKYMSEDDE